MMGTPGLPPMSLVPLDVLLTGTWFEGDDLRSKVVEVGSGDAGGAPVVEGIA